MGVNMQHYKTALVIGRFQPFHYGHAYLLQKAAEIADTVIIGIGSANKKDADNPWDAHIRRKMLEAYITHEKLTEKVHTIVNLDDMSDADWTNMVLKLAPADVVVGNNDWVNHLLTDAGYEVMTLPYLDRFLYEGQKIRANMKQGKKWQDAVPSYITPLLHSI
jgi:nicotinamide-nucleotide adenylyltransferase